MLRIAAPIQVLTCVVLSRPKLIALYEGKFLPASLHVSKPPCSTERPQPECVCVEAECICLLSESEVTCTYRPCRDNSQRGPLQHSSEGKSFLI